jgi:hypothetical protein
VAAGYGPDGKYQLKEAIPGSQGTITGDKGGDDFADEPESGTGSGKGFAVRFFQGGSHNLEPMLKTLL